MNEVDVIKKAIELLGGNAKCRERYAAELENFHMRERQARANKYRLGVIGVTSSGKSTMINALLSEALLPQAAKPSSSQLVSCFHSAKRQAQVYFEDGSSKIFSGSPLTPDLIRKYGDENVNKRNKEKVKQIELSTPKFPFDESVILVDSPGLDAFGYEGHERLTMENLLPTIDFCIFVTTCKTNSDDKMKSVLDTIAKYEIPVIIVQNMIDSLNTNHGEKTIAEVAQDHRRRVERIVSQSDIKDKSKVQIVQISAKWALDALICRNEDEEKLRKSNYKVLVEKVKSTFERIRPEVEGRRMFLLKNEILRIANASIKDGEGGELANVKFEYEDDETNYIKSREYINTELKKKIDSLNHSLLSFLNANNIDQTDIECIKKEVADCEKVICKLMDDFNKTIIGLCNKLNIDSRSIISDFRFDKPELRLKRKNVRVDSGYYRTEKPGMFKRFIGKITFGRYKPEGEKVWIDTSHDEKVIDREGTMQKAEEYIDGSLKVIRHNIDLWSKSVDITEKELFSQLDNRRKEFEARRSKALDCKVYLEIGEKLQYLAGKIKDFSEKKSNVNHTKTDVNVKTYNISVSREVIAIYRLSEILRLRIHNETIKHLLGSHKSANSKNVVIGWDEFCEASFVYYAFSQSVAKEKIRIGNNSINKNVEIINKPQRNVSIQPASTKNVFLLVNATQIGAAENEISKIAIGGSLKRGDKLFFVVQDFQEIITGGTVDETLGNMIRLVNRKEFKADGRNLILLLHDNPIYNLAAVEAQQHGNIKQTDEIRILGELREKFRFLLPKASEQKAIQTIINKLGNL